MKKSLILGLLGLAAAVAPCFGQGTVFLDNYFTGGPNINYGEAGVPANGQSGAAGVSGAGVNAAGWTMGLYYVVGTQVVPADPNPKPIGDPSVFGGLTLGTGAGSTASIFAPPFSTAGEGFSSGFFAVPGTAIGGGTTITLEIVAYNGADYASSTFRGHSAAFTMAVSSSSSPSPNPTGSAMPSFSVYAVPEPSVFALSGLGAAALMLIRRKK